jgi:hypothetical protein
VAAVFIAAVNHNDQWIVLILVLMQKGLGGAVIGRVIARGRSSGIRGWIGHHHDGRR